jgi:glycosyltransferase involved in cell wall biosynthesis
MIVAGISAFNEENTIARVVIHAGKHVDKVLVVDDGSNDDTALIAERLGAQVIKHERNLGRGAALRGCFRWANEVGADVLVTLDADGQHDPEDIPSILDPILKGEADVAIGSRTVPGEMPTYRRFGGKLLDRVVGVRVDGANVDSQSGLRAYSHNALRKITVTESGMGADSQILMTAKEAGLRIVEVPARIRYKGLDTSTHNPAFHLFDVFFSVIKFMSIRHPFLFYGGFSAIMFVIAITFGFQTLEFYSREGRVVTNLALVSVSAGILAFLSFFTGAILFTLITVLRERR